jgi:hypothetical protein
MTRSKRKTGKAAAGVTRGKAPRTAPGDMDHGF